MKSLMTLLIFLFFTTSSFATELNKSEVMNFLNEWLSAQNTGSYSDYAAMYSNSFTGVKRSGSSTSKLNHDAWLKDRKKMFNKKIVVAAKNPEVNVSGVTATVKFQQAWESGTYKDKGNKVLNLVIENGILKIVKEEMLSSKISIEPSLVFSSTFTDLQKDCKDKFPDIEDGNDIPVVCKGPKGYIIDVEFSACCEHMQIEGEKDFLLLFPMQLIDTVMKRKLEWRLANGKPFAVIFKIDKYKGDITINPRKNREVIVTKGLNGFKCIDHEIESKQFTDPNQEARRLVDDSYMRLSVKM